MAGSERDPWPARLAFIATSAALATVVWGAVTAGDRTPATALTPAEARPAAADVRGIEGSQAVPAAAEVRGLEAPEASGDRDHDDDRAGHDDGDDESDDDDDEDEHRPSVPSLRTRGS